MIETYRAVEVLHDRAPQNPRWSLGSGFVIRAGIVLTASHNVDLPGDTAGSEGTIVRTIDGREHKVETIIVRDESRDLALLGVPTIAATPVALGRVSRTAVGVVREVMSVGFPNYKFAPERPVHERRQPAQAYGHIPTAEDITAEALTLKLETGLPTEGELDEGSPWGGFSGAGVVVNDHLIGIVIEHHPAEGMGALRIVPIECVLDLDATARTLFTAVLGCDSRDSLPCVNEGHEEVHDGLRGELREIADYLQQGLLRESEASQLRIIAYKNAKGWRGD